jgi:thiamine-phosphate pyrophosphorylase
MISHLHFLTQDLSDYSHTQQTLTFAKAGGKWVQFRSKKLSPADKKSQLLSIQKIAADYKMTVIVNDDVALTELTNAHGVHLGKSDMPILEARKILGTNRLIGGTANTQADINQLVEAGVDYIGIGPFRFTATKKNLSPILGLGGIRLIVAETKIKNANVTLIAIGGITLEDIEELHQTGVSGVAISSAVNLSPDPLASAKEWVKRCEVFLKNR